MAYNTKNLIPLSQRTKEDRHRIASEGGKASGEAKRKKKMLSEYLNIAINSSIQNPEALQYTATHFEFKEGDLNYNACVVGGLIEAAVKGNIEAVKLIREMTNDKPVGSDEKKGKVSIPAELIGKAFTEINHYINTRKYQDYMMEGGRASTKSSFAGLKTIELIENNPKWCAVCLRRVQNTLRKSIYSQICWAIEELDKYVPRT